MDTFSYIRQQLLKGDNTIVNYFDYYAGSCRNFEDTKENVINKLYDDNGNSIECFGYDYGYKLDLRKMFLVRSIYYKNKELFFRLIEDYFDDNDRFPMKKEYEYMISEGIEELDKGIENITYDVTINDIPYDWLKSIYFRLFSKGKQKLINGIWESIDRLYIFSEAELWFLRESNSAIFFEREVTISYRDCFFVGNIIHDWIGVNRHVKNSNTQTYFLSQYLEGNFQTGITPESEASRTKIKHCILASKIIRWKEFKEDFKKEYLELKELNYPFLKFHEYNYFLEKRDLKEIIKDYFIRKKAQVGNNSSIEHLVLQGDYNSIFVWDFPNEKGISMSKYFFDKGNYKIAADCLLEVTVLGLNYYKNENTIEESLLAVYFLYQLAGNNEKQKEVLSILELFLVNTERHDDMALIYQSLQEFSEFEKICKEYNLQNLITEHYKEKGSPEKAEEIILGITVDDLFQDDKDPSTNANQCVKCNSINPENAKYCLECGTKLQFACPKCGSTSFPASKFCGECGTKL